LKVHFAVLRTSSQYFSLVSNTIINFLYVFCLLDLKTPSVDSIFLIEHFIRTRNRFILSIHCSFNKKAHHYYITFHAKSAARLQERILSCPCLAL
jgi:hypothetical protein